MDFLLIEHTIIPVDVRWDLNASYANPRGGATPEGRFF